MNYTNYLLPGDKVKSNIESLDFHKGLTYEIANVYQNGREVIVTVLSKKREEIIFNDYAFDVSHTKLYKRAMKWRIQSLWDFNSCATFGFPHKFNLMDGDYFEIENKTIFGSDKTGKQIAHIQKHNRIIDFTHKERTKYVNYTTTKIFKYEDFEKFFFNLDAIEKLRTGLTLERVSFSDQEQIDLMTMLVHSQYPKFEKELRTVKTLHMNFSKTTPEEFKIFIADLIFDTKYLNEIQKRLVNVIMNLFKILPKSHGPTSVAKILHGRTKLKNENITEYIGLYKDFIRYDQLFELCANIESFLTHTKIFTEYKVDKNDKSEWLGTYEYIGSKQIDVKKLNALMNLFKKKL